MATLKDPNARDKLYYKGRHQRKEQKEHHFKDSTQLTSLE
jgi:hypothetical protein